ncbi:hypothetical protein ARSEF4850_009672 [Beauveria asiatica]
MSLSEITAEEFGEWLDGTFIGDPATSREFCERNLSPDYQGNKIAIRYTVNLIFGDTPEQHMELMFMAERDAEGRFQKVWELTEPINESAEN